MAKQSDYERINRLIIMPMSATWNTKVPEGMVQAFIEDLAPYSDDTLAAAFREVRRTSKTPPRIAHFVEACRNIGGGSSGIAVNTDQFLAGLRKREYEARKKASDFLNRFSTTELALQARAEGWERRLLDYAYEAAWLQAQFIDRIPNPGFSQGPLVNRRNEDTELRCREFVDACRRQARTGSIEVTVPDHLIEEWRPRAA